MQTHTYTHTAWESVKQFHRVCSVWLKQDCDTHFENLCHGAFVHLQVKRRCFFFFPWEIVSCNALLHMPVHDNKWAGGDGIKEREEQVKQGEVRRNRARMRTRGRQRLEDGYACVYVCVSSACVCMCARQAARVTPVTGNQVTEATRSISCKTLLVQLL